MQEKSTQNRSDTLKAKASKSGEFVASYQGPIPDSIQLPNTFIFQSSIKIAIDQLALDRSKYRLDASKGMIFFIRTPFDTSTHQIDIRYRALPIRLKTEFYKKELEITPAKTAQYQEEKKRRDTLKVKTAPKPAIDDLFGNTKLRKSGSIIRGINVGSNQDLNVTSGLRLQLDGEIADGVTVSAALTDENTPIQPEGNTQTLSEFDRVYVEIKSKAAKAVIGDFVSEFQGTEFANLSRRLQGAEVGGATDFGQSAFSLKSTAAFAVSRGRFAFNQFNGQDGVQGPYRLRGVNNEPFIVVLAGTERIYVDGVLQVRGQNNDYVIEYGTGEILFQPRRLITQQSRITADFQYTDRLYPRNYISGKTNASLFDSLLTLQATYINESDDENSPIDFLLSDDAKRILAAAGGDRFKASDTSGFFRGFDAQGFPAGSYEQVDTVVNGVVQKVYRYLGQGATGAIWSPIFSFAGDGIGNYRRLSIGIFEYAGEGGGSYVASRLLPIANAQNLMDFALLLRPFSGFRIEAEGALSQNDVNKFSIIEDSLKAGNAYKIGASLLPTEISLGATKLGSLQFAFSERNTSRSFAFIDRTLPVDLNRDFNLIDFDGRSLFSLPSAENIRNASIGFSPFLPKGNRLNLNYAFGGLKRDRLFEATRHELRATFSGDSLGSGSYVGSYMQSENQESRERATWLRQTVKGAILLREALPSIFTFGLEPFFTIDLSDKDTRDALLDSLRNDSHHIIDLNTGLKLTGLFGQSLTLGFGYRTDELPVRVNDSAPLELFRASAAKTITADWRYFPDGVFLAQLTLTSRLREFTEVFRQRGNADNETFLVRLQTKYTPLRGALESEFLYDVGTEKTARLERQFFPVPRGFGSFIWVDRNQNRLREFDEFIPFRLGDVGTDSLQYVLRTFPSDDLFPTIDLKSSFRIRLRPTRLLGRGENLIEKVIAALSSETLFRVEERSLERELSRIYFFDFSRFQNDSTTIFGSITIQQDVFLFENDITNLRFRFQERKSQNQFSLGIERRIFRERSFRFVTRVGYELGIDVTGQWQTNRSSASTETIGSGFTGAQGRQFDLTIFSLLPDLSYRPIQDLEFGLRLNVDFRQNDFPTQNGNPPEEVFYNAQQLRATYSFRGKGRVSALLERTDTRFTNTSDAGAIYELTGGFLEGTTYQWRVDGDYRISSFITATVSYDARALPTGRTLHTARAEVRAVF
ncbi:MAG: hypothetical protein SFU91_00810 [Chloroherpetonaceae bacterium]|nr:hypothetical protein [Chloroherpetonaceae bacterium]